MRFAFLGLAFCAAAYAAPHASEHTVKDITQDVKRDAAVHEIAVAKSEIAEIETRSGLIAYADGLLGLGDLLDSVLGLVNDRKHSLSSITPIRADKIGSHWRSRRRS
jgi:hypothetical protein